MSDPMNPITVEPLSGSAVRVVITVNGLPVVDTDLTLLYLRAKMAGGEEQLPVHFMPFPAPSEEDLDTPREPVQEVHAVLSMTILDIP